MLAAITNTMIDVHALLVYHRIGKELEKVKVCEPSCHRAGRSRARELALGETNTAYRALECTYRITSRREQLRRTLSLSRPRDFNGLTRDGDVPESSEHGPRPAPSV